MGLFDRLYYGKAGKRDYSEMDMPKNRISLFFMVLKDHVFDLVKVNLLQVVFWIPFLLWTYINLAAVQSIDTEAVLAAEGGAANLMSAISGYVMMWLLGLIPCIAITVRRQPARRISCATGRAISTPSSFRITRMRLSPTGSRRLPCLW